MKDPSDKKTGDTAVTEVHAPTNAADDEAMLRVVVVEGRNVGAAVALVRSTATVGRHPTNDLVLEDPAVSSVHLELSRHSAGRLLVKDSGSTNGTWLGDHRIAEVELSTGAHIRVGDTVLRVETDPRALPAPASAALTRFEGLIGATPEMRELFSVLARIAGKPLGLLVQGETGTGKEQVARAVHARSPRATMPFVVLDATTIPQTLGESVLFGHEQGAFSGAESSYQGAFERANGGTLFIEEVGELPAALQPKLLRVLEHKQLVRIGGNETVAVDVRVIAGTRRDLRLEIEAGRFREDLYFRLAQVRVVVPPLRARPDDIAALARHFLGQMVERGGVAPVLSEAALAELRRRPFPGNVRELQSILVRAAALSENNTILVGDIAGEGYGFRGSEAERSPLVLGGTFSDAKQRAIERFEKAYLETLMRRTAGNLSRAAREADLARHHLRDLLKKRGLYGAHASEPEPTAGDRGDDE